MVCCDSARGEASGCPGRADEGEGGRARKPEVREVSILPTKSPTPKNLPEADINILSPSQSPTETNIRIFVPTLEPNKDPAQPVSLIRVLEPTQGPEPSLNPSPAPSPVPSTDDDADDQTDGSDSSERDPSSDSDNNNPSNQLYSSNASSGRKLSAAIGAVAVGAIAVGTAATIVYRKRLGRQQQQQMAAAQSLGAKPTTSTLDSV